MSHPYIRQLKMEYSDPLQKLIRNQKLPKKFIEDKEDDYKVKRNINVRPNRLQKSQYQQNVPESCLSKFCCCINFNVELCPDCRMRLCRECKKSATLKFSMCKNCKQNLCSTCKRTLQGKKIKLRNYKIKLKNMKQLHFQDCHCQQCYKSS